MYVLVHSLYISGSLAGTKGDLGWAASALQLGLVTERKALQHLCRATEMLKCFPSSHLPQLEPQGLPGSTVSPAEQADTHNDAHFHPSCTDLGLKAIPALECGPRGTARTEDILIPLLKLKWPKDVIWAAGKYRRAFRCRLFIC